MEFHFRRPLAFLSAAVLAAAFAAPHSIAAQKTDHLVSPGDLDKAAQEATQVRRQNIDTLRDFLSSPKAQKALEQAHINPVEVQNADKARNDFAAGNMTDHDLLVILVAVAVIILIIVAVH
jgi:Flp pilus assembly protein TadB